MAAAGPPAYGVRYALEKWEVSAMSAMTLMRSHPARASSRT
jgi:hypothetical protein